MLKKFLKNDKGLTLVELLAVIVILGIIAAIAVPSIGKIIDNSKDDAKVAEALQIISAAKLAKAEDPGSNQWVSDADGSDLSDYLSKVKDDVFTVDFVSSNNTYTITGHEAAGVLDKENTVAITEDELAAAASK
ncbi:type II secretion system protein [Bacillus sp. V3]|nr:type II secretion system protein [Bacillus sp. V3]